MKLTRRQLVIAAAGSAFAANAAAQSAPTTPGPVTVTVPPATPDFAKQARDNVQSNAAALAKFAIPMATEPAFQFKA
jgi:hypothetical protein